MAMASKLRMFSHSGQMTRICKASSLLPWNNYSWVMKNPWDLHHVLGGKWKIRRAGAAKRWWELTKICSARNACLEQSQVYLNLLKICHTYSHQQPLHCEKIRKFPSHITKVFSTFVLKCCCIWDFASAEQISFYPLLSGAFSVGHSRKSSLFPASFGCRDTDSFLLWAAKWKTEKNVIFCPKHWHWNPHPRHRVCIGFG